MLITTAQSFRPAPNAFKINSRQLADIRIGNCCIRIRKRAAPRINRQDERKRDRYGGGCKTCGSRPSSEVVSFAFPSRPRCGRLLELKLTKGFKTAISVVQLVKINSQ